MFANYEIPGLIIGIFIIIGFFYFIKTRISRPRKKARGSLGKNGSGNRKDYSS
jgi:hypothetical protein